MNLIDSLRGKDREQQLSKDEVALKLRDVTLHFLCHGVIGSNVLISRGENKSAIKLPSLLYYSPGVTKHFQTLIGVLTNPREFKIVSDPTHAWKDDTPDGDVLHHKEKIGDFYYFANHLTSPFINSFAAAFDRHKKLEPVLDIGFVRYNDGIWKVIYDYLEWSPLTMADEDFVEASYPHEKARIGMLASSTYPERANLLNFTLSPNKLSAEYFISTCASKIIQPFLLCTQVKQVGSFEVQTIHFDATGLERQMARMDTKDLRPEILHTNYALERHCLVKDGDRDFGIVLLGKVEIGNLTYWIYTGSERPLAREKVLNLDRGKQKMFQTSRATNS